jgi:hypothetical protein
MSEFGMPFRKLPIQLRRRWWEWTYYGKHPATNELMWTIEALNPEAAEYLRDLELKNRESKSAEIEDRW